MPTALGTTDPNAPAQPTGAHPAGRNDEAPSRKHEPDHDGSARATARRIVRRLAITLGVLLLLWFLAQLRPPGDDRPLSPDSVKPNGAHALAALLDSHGVKLRRTDNLLDASSPSASAANRTVVLLPNHRISEDGWSRIAEHLPAHLVLVEPSADALQALVPEVAPGSTGTFSFSRDPGCNVRAATQAGRLSHTGRVFRAAGGSGTVSGCYGDGQTYTLVRIERDGHTIDVFGATDTWKNEHLAKEGNAALALNLLGSHRGLTWIEPRTDSAQEPPPSLLWPQLRYGAWMVAITVLVLGLAMSRRLGPVVAERLPAVVRATETTLGRARLYRRFKAYDSAADGLRRTTRRRLSRRLHVSVDADSLAEADRSALIGAVLAAAPHRGGPEVHHLLYGPEPTSEAELLDLAAELAALTEEVSRT